MLLVATAAVAAPLDAQQALAKAIAVLKGDPYGASAEAVGKHIVGSEMLSAGSVSKCTGGKTAVAAWEFHIRVADAAKGQPGGFDSPIDGYLTLDGVSGAMICANLPFMD